MGTAHHASRAVDLGDGTSRRVMEWGDGGKGTSEVSHGYFQSRACVESSWRDRLGSWLKLKIIGEEIGSNTETRLAIRDREGGLPAAYRMFRDERPCSGARIAANPMKRPRGSNESPRALGSKRLQ